MTNQTMLWRRLDRPGHESAHLSFQDLTWRLTGTSIFMHNRQPCRLNYQVICDPEWNTLSGRVAGWVEGRTLEIEITVDSKSRWSLNGNEIPEVKRCLDLDLNFSPSTNLLPIRRLDLAVGKEANVKAAWLRFPGFTLEPINQKYRRISTDTYQYESAGGKFKTELKVNGAGFVIDYPNYYVFEATS